MMSDECQIFKWSFRFVTQMSDDVRSSKMMSDKIRWISGNVRKLSGGGT